MFDLKSHPQEGRGGRGGRGMQHYFCLCHRCCCCCRWWCVVLLFPFVFACQVVVVCLYVLFFLFFPFATLVLFRFLAWFSISLTCSIYIHVILFLNISPRLYKPFSTISQLSSVSFLHFLKSRWWSTRKPLLLWPPYTFLNLYCNYFIL